MKGQILSSGIIPVLYKSREPKFLSLRVYNYWDFPKGLVERGESSLDAAARELKEETGLSEPKFDWGHRYYDTEVYSDHKVARYYLARMDSERVELKRNEITGIVEHHEFRWCTYSIASQLTGLRVRNALDWAFENHNEREALVSARWSTYCLFFLQERRI